jgi:hypothetical protein
MSYLLQFNDNSVYCFRKINYSFFSVLLFQLLHAPSTVTQNKWDEFIEQVERYDINHSLFDIVVSIALFK